MDASPEDTVSPASNPPPLETVPPILFSGMDRVCPCCPGHTACYNHTLGQQQRQASDLSASMAGGGSAAAAAGDISLDDGSCILPDGDIRRGYYTAMLGFDSRPDSDGDRPTDAYYYGADWMSEGASDVEELDTASVEVSIDEKDLALRDEEVAAGAGTQ